MTDGFDVELTDDARREIHGFGGAAAARIGERIRHAQEVGWQESQQIGLVKNLGSIEQGIYEIIVKGKGEAYRILCFPVAMRDGRLVVLTSCVAKSKLLHGGLKRHVRIAASRRDKWLQANKEGNL